MVLTPKQQRFVDAYLGEAQGDTVKAYRAAGYRGDDNTCAIRADRFLRNAKVEEEIARRLNEHGLSRAEVLDRVADQARGIGAFLEIRGDELEWNLDLMRREGKLHLIRRIRTTRYGQNIEFADAQAALFLLCRYYGVCDGGDPTRIPQAWYEAAASHDQTPAEPEGFTRARFTDYLEKIMKLMEIQQKCERGEASEEAVRAAEEALLRG